ncbi:MAG: hypothetical protein KUG81_10030 [Gammaproteobacteria bacterium]|nr:hypothetical protein [Gammaproteobacteria bacterium]
MKDKTVREYLFANVDGCTSHDCIIKKREGMGTNGSCGCLHNMSRSQLHILKSRLSVIVDKTLTDT